MLIIKFQGALGNQMFEYAFMKRMQKEYPGNDVLGYIPPIRDFNGYEIERVFNISIPKANLLSVAKLSNRVPEAVPFSRILNFVRKWKLLLNGEKESHIKEDDNSYYYPDVFRLNMLKSYFLDGVWANALYLEGIQEEIKKDFVFSDERGKKNDEYLETIKKTESISIHVRRNEYVKKGLSIASDDYYRRSIKYMQEKIKNPSFFVFSDDHVYCKQLFDGIIDYTLIEGNVLENSYRDMELMSNCKHNIIANSTFSFWGAYLNNYIDKIVIAPNISWGDLRCPFACFDWKILDI